MKLTKGTIVRTILTLFVVINMVLQALGKDVINVTDGEITAFVELAVQIAVIVTGFWYNNSFTEKARKADEYLKDLNKGE